MHIYKYTYPGCCQYFVCGMIKSKQYTAIHAMESKRNCLVYLLWSKNYFLLLKYLATLTYSFPVGGVRFSYIV